MAALKDITETIAEATGLVAFDVRYRARFLRGAGILPASKRGRGSTPLTTREAAQILIGCLVSDSAVKVATLTRTYAGLRQSLVHARGIYTTEITAPKHMQGPFANALTFLLDICTSQEAERS